MQAILALVDMSSWTGSISGVLGFVATIVVAIISYWKWRQEHALVSDLSIQVGSLDQQAKHAYSEREQLQSKLETDHLAHALALKDAETKIDGLQLQNAKLQNEVGKSEKNLRHQTNLAKRML